LNDEELIAETIKLAKRGLGLVNPNPMVGAVIVKDGEIISKGYHKFFGGPHAEIEAIKNAKKDIKGGVLYVNIEPCCHFGKTPPCVNALINSGIKKVVIGDIDPNPIVKGKGIKFLSENGIEVIQGILTNECRKLNVMYYKYMNTGLPYISLKIAQTIDSKISKKKGEKTDITSIESKKVVHKLRSMYDAVLIGKNTAMIDNPSLNVRLYKGRSPKRIILDENLKINTNLRLLNEPFSKDTIIFTTSDYDHKIMEKLLEKSVKVVITRKDKNGLIDLKYMLKKFSKLNITSIFVEGGSKIFTSFINQKLVDKIYLFIAPKIFIKGVNAFNGSCCNEELLKKMNLKFENIKKINDDLLIEVKLG
jgi:diaminohydroxyphosphoribosylaminopyrimidine deaminase/5-amino-6-(5-phosphoribosylamino)uracil reductase